MGGKNVEEQMEEVVFNGREDGSQVSFRSLYNDDINIDVLIHQLVTTSSYYTFLL